MACQHVEPVVLLGWLAYCLLAYQRVVCLIDALIGAVSLKRLIHLRARLGLAILASPQIEGQI